MGNHYVLSWNDFIRTYRTERWLYWIQALLNTCYIQATILIYRNSFISPSFQYNYRDNYSPFYRWINWGTDKIGDLPKFTPPAISSTGIQILTFSSRTYALSTEFSHRKEAGDSVRSYFSIHMERSEGQNGIRDFKIERTDGSDAIEAPSPVWRGVGDSEGEKRVREDILVWDSTHKKQSTFCGGGEEFSFGHVEQGTHVEISCKCWKCGLEKVWSYRCWNTEGIIEARVGHIIKCRWGIGAQTVSPYYFAFSI